jgi:hypothetical protein
VIPDAGKSARKRRLIVEPGIAIVSACQARAKDKAGNRLSAARDWRFTVDE